MTQIGFGDESLIALARRRGRRQKATLVVTSLVDSLLAAWGILMFERFQNGRSIEPAQVISLAVLAATVNVIGGLLIWGQRPPAAIYDARILAKQSDALLRHRTRLFLLFPVGALSMTPILVLSSLLLLDGADGLHRLTSVAMIFSASVFTLTRLGYVTGVSFAKRVRPLLNDELSQLHRAKAFEAGFWAAMAGGVALYAVGLFQPKWSVAGLPAVLMWAVGAASLRFAWLERRADHDG